MNINGGLPIKYEERKGSVAPRLINLIMFGIIGKQAAVA